jgi:hypothetical protein
MPSIVQFFHPGGEHGFDKNCSNDGSLIKDWNNITIDHQRKFLLNEGSYIENGERHEGKLLFWGEWEPPSRVKELKLQSYCPPYGKNPKYLHYPFLPPDDQIKVYQEKHYYQNTDPFVFGNNFIYGICRQKMKSLRILEPGSLIIFGSRVNFRFVIDTIFVVKTANPYFSLDDINKMNLGNYPDVVTQFITDENDKVGLHIGNILYTGATFDDQVHNMYSFVPAKVFYGEEIGFPRFFMPDNFYTSSFTEYFQRFEKREDKIFEGGMIGIKLSNGTTSDIYKFWEYIKTAVSKDHVLGFNFKIPTVDKDFHWKKPEN